jgi:hypothetical protein
MATKVNQSKEQKPNVRKPKAADNAKAPKKKEPNVRKPSAN